MKTTTREMGASVSVPQSQELIDHQVATFRSEIDDYDARNAVSFEETTNRLRAYSETRADNAEQGEKPSRLGRIRAKLGKLATSAMDKLGYLNARANVSMMQATSSVGDIVAHRKEKRESMTPAQLKRRRWARNVGVVAATTAGLFIGKEIFAEAQTIVNGGRMDTTSGGARQMLGGSLGVGNPDDKLINYPAAMIPGVDQGGTWNSSSEVAQGEITNAMNANGDGYDNVVGYSQGTDPVLRTAQRVAAENGGALPDNFDATMIGGPSVKNSGFGDDPLTKAMSPLLEGAGLSIDPGNVPAGSTVIGKQGDFWPNSGGKNPIAKVDQLIGFIGGDSHAYSAHELNDVANQTSFVGEDGVRYVTIHDGGTPALDVAEKNGFLVTDEARELSRSITGLDRSEIGKPAPEFDPVRFGNALTDFAADTARRTGVPVPDLPQMNAPAAPVEMPAPAPMPAPIEIPPVVNQVVEAITQQAPMPVEMPAPAPIVQQVQEVVQQFTAPANSAPPAPAPVIPQMGQINAAIANSPFAGIFPR